MACTPKPAPVAEPDAALARSEVRVDPELVRTGRIVVGVAEARVPRDEVSVPGEVVVGENGEAQVTSLVAGRVATLDVEVGTNVQKGQTVATVDSPQVGAAQADLLRAQSRAVLAKRVLERQLELQRTGMQPCTRSDGTPILVRDIATIRDGSAQRQSFATADGRGETVYAMVQMVAGGNAHAVAADVKAKLDELATRLPPGAKIQPFYDRAAFVDRVLGTVRRSLLEGGIIVAVVLFLMLGDFMAGVIVATAIPLAMLGAFALMRLLGLSGNLMSLGAIDFGLVVDGAVVIVEGTLATMVAEKMRVGDAIVHEGKTVGRPITLGVLILAIVYVPVLLLEGVEGKSEKRRRYALSFMRPRRTSRRDNIASARYVIFCAGIPSTSGDPSPFRRGSAESCRSRTPRRSCPPCPRETRARL